MHFSGNLQALLASSTARQTVTASNGMKFILVNAADHRGAQITTTTAAPLPTITQNNIMPQQNSNSIQQPQKSQQTVKTPPKNVQNNTARKRLLETSSTDRDTLRKRELSGIKSTLQKLLKAKEESNEMAAQRLALERERLQFERTIAEKFLGIFEQNQKIQQQLIQQQIQQNHHHQSQQRPTTTQQIFTTTTGNPATATAIQNQGQIMIPPKLLITTMVPTSVATSSAGSANTKVITTANIKNVTNTLTLEQPLLIPKEEPLD
uniref:Potato leaf roll virus readthrough protein n=1 Tax=Musca domestica TaxID=7370 RepID=T1PKA5_MUSDO